MPESLRFDCTGDVAAEAATQALVRQGFHVVRSFDLHSALDVHVDGLGLQYGAEQSIGQFVVLLVYSCPAPSAGHAPVVVTTHGRGGQAEIQIVRDVNDRSDEGLVGRVWGTLREATLSAQPMPDLVAAARTGT